MSSPSSFRGEVEALQRASVRPFMRCRRNAASTPRRRSQALPWQQPSLRESRVDVDHRATFVDGIGSRSVFPRMLARAQGLLDGSLVSTLDEIAAALRLLAERARVIAEGAGACGVAAAMSGRAGRGKVVCVVSGGNIDTDRLMAILGR